MVAAASKHHSRAGVIVVLNAFPGTGKLTIMEKVKDLFPADTVCLLDNHLLIDPVVAIIPQRNAAHHELRRRVRRPIFEELSRSAQGGQTILMTACLVKHNDMDHKFLQEHLDMVRGTNVSLIWADMHCDEETSMRRVISPERRQRGKAKLTDPCILQDLLRSHQLLEPSKNAVEGMNVIVQRLDASGSVETSVSRLMNIIRSVDGFAH